MADLLEISILIAFNLARKSGPAIWYCKDLRFRKDLDEVETPDSGDAIAELDAEVDADDDVPLRSKNFWTPAFCISCGVQKVFTLDWICAYFLLLTINERFTAFGSSGFDGVKKSLTSRREDGTGSFWKIAR